MWAVVAVALVAAGFAAMSCGGGTQKKTPTNDPTANLNTQGKVRLAQSYLEAGRAAEAVKVIEDAVADDPENPSLYNYFGQLGLLTGRLGKAEWALQEALRLDPHFTDAHNNLGAVYDRLGRKQDAEREFLACLKDPSYPTPEKVYLNLGILYRSEERLQEAITMFRKAVGIDPKYYQGHYELALTLEAVGRLEEAVREFEVAAPAYRNSGPYHYRLGFSYMRIGDEVKARENLQRVLEVSPGSESAAQADDLLKVLN